MNLDEYQEEFAADSASRQWRLLTANDGFLLEKEFAVREKRFSFFENLHEDVFLNFIF